MTTCTNNRRQLLNNPVVHARWIEFGKEGPDHGAWVGAYVLMLDHLHAFVAIDDRETDLSAWVKSLKNTVSKVLRVNRVPSPHWQKGFFDHVLRSEE
ncbi:MAG: transposase [Verrucomicrobiota bacterium]